MKELSGTKLEKLKEAISVHKVDLANWQEGNDPVKLSDQQVEEQVGDSETNSLKIKESQVYTYNFFLQIMSLCYVHKSFIFMIIT